MINANTHITHINNCDTKLTHYNKKLLNNSNCYNFDHDTFNFRNNELISNSQNVYKQYYN